MDPQELRNIEVFTAEPFQHVDTEVVQKWMDDKRVLLFGDEEIKDYGAFRSSLTDVLAFGGLGKKMAWHTLYIAVRGPPIRFIDAALVKAKEA